MKGAEVIEVQSREICSFAIRGGKHKVRRGCIYITVKKGEVFINVKKVVSQPITKNIMVQYVAVKAAVVKDMSGIPLSLTMEREMKDSVVNNAVEQYVAVKSAMVEDMCCILLSLTRDSVMKDSSEYSNREEVLAEPGMSMWSEAEEV